MSDQPTPRFLPFLLFAAIAAVLGFQISNLQNTSKKAGYSDPMIGKSLPAFSAPLWNQPNNHLDNSYFGEKPKLLNMMASWCGPCRLEHDLLRDYAESRQIPIYGIAWKDTAEALQNFFDQNGNIYAEIGLDAKGETAIGLGLTGVPETYLISADGKIAMVYRGMLTKEILFNYFDPALEKLRSMP